MFLFLVVGIAPPKVGMGQLPRPAQFQAGSSQGVNLTTWMDTYIAPAPYYALAQRQAIPTPVHAVGNLGGIPPLPHVPATFLLLICHIHDTINMKTKHVHTPSAVTECCNM